MLFFSFILLKIAFSKKQGSHFWYVKNSITNVLLAKIYIDELKLYLPLNVGIVSDLNGLNFDFWNSLEILVIHNMQTSDSAYHTKNLQNKTLLKFWSANFFGYNLDMTEASAFLFSSDKIIRLNFSMKNSIIQVNWIEFLASTLYTRIIII